ncbi:MAG: flavodoxin family protein [Methanomassiliicoccales archaeon]|nr:flavodoxin family protein [Methanomassiliicoccales archaeon]
MSLLVLGLNGSPRRHGNSETLLSEALKGAEEAGANTLQFNLAFMEISSCEACEECFTDGECIVLDEMCRLYDTLEAADAVIVASPIYFSGMSAQTKTAVDRCQALWARRTVLKVPRKPGVGAIILSAAQPQAKFENAVSELRAFMIGIGVRPVSILTVPGLSKKGSAAERPEALSSARSLGQELVRALTADP